MTPGPRGVPGARAAVRDVLTGLVLLSLVAVAAVTLTATGDGWTWAAPQAELQWYVTGLGVPATRAQLLGNLVLLVPTAALLVLRWPLAGRPAALLAIAVAIGCGIELLQWTLPLGRVVSPVDAFLNATGAIAAGTWTRLARYGASGDRIRRTLLPSSRSGSDRALTGSSQA